VAVLFVDTFNGTFESENAWAAPACCRPPAMRCTPSPRIRRPPVLRPHLPGGRAWSTRRGKAAELIDALLPFAQAGVAIVGLEPSCLLTLRDEAWRWAWATRRAPVAAQALLFEEFLAREAEGRPLRAAPSAAGAKPMLLHGHCHQKAFGA
jgi:hypothetical protein